MTPHTTDPRPILLLSNGHGEDLSGALIGRALAERGLTVEALPLVGHGRAYEQAGIRRRGRTREYSTGGLGYTSAFGRLTELVQGQVIYLLSRLLLLLRIARSLSADPGGGGCDPRDRSLAERTAHSHLSGGLFQPLRRQTSAPMALCSRACASAAPGRSTAAMPSPPPTSPASCNVQCTFSAIPFSMELSAPANHSKGHPSQRLGLLPGSRLPEALHNLELMLRVLERLPEPLRPAERLGLHAALVGKLTPQEVAPLASRLGWKLQLEGEERCSLQRGPLQLQLEWGRFAAVVQQCDLLLSMTGTAAEQCVGLGKPVLQLVGDGPQFTANFAEAQRRLLGPGLFCASGPTGSEEQLDGTAALLEQLLARLLSDGGWRAALQQLGRERIGSGGGAARMAADLRTHLDG